MLMVVFIVYFCTTRENNVSGFSRVYMFMSYFDYTCYYNRKMFDYKLTVQQQILWEACSLEGCLLDLGWVLALLLQLFM